MKFKREIIAIMLIICMLFTISAISAADSGEDTIGVANDTVEVSSQDYSMESNDDVEILSTEDEVAILEATDDGSFKALQSKIWAGKRTVYLENDYEYDASKDSGYWGMICYSMTINGQNHKIDAKGSSNIFEIIKYYDDVPVTQVVFRDIVFMNADSSYYGGGGAINVKCNTTTVYIINCTFINNIDNQYSGGAIKSESNLNIANSKFINNSAKSGGAIYSSGKNIQILNSIFINNTDSSNYGGGGGAISTKATTFIRNSSFINNIAINFDGGAIGSYGGTITCIDSNFINNSAKYGGAIRSQSGRIQINNSTFKNNNASIYGGAIYGYQSIDQDLGSIANSTFINNFASSNGGAIYNNYGDSCAVDRCIFINNTLSNRDSIGSATYYLTKITNSIFLNHEGRYIYSYDSIISNNWFGNDGDNFDECPLTANNLRLVDNWYYLDAKNKQNQLIWSLKLYDHLTGESSVVENYNLPDITFILTPENLTLDNRKMKMNKTGQHDFEYALNSETGLLSVQYETFKYDLKISKGEFDTLQDLMNSANANDEIKLTRNYTYNLHMDSIVDGIVIDKPGLTIDGNGFTIDARGQSRIFKITENAHDVIIKNLILTNGSASVGSVIYSEGDTLNVFDSIFINNGENQISATDSTTIEKCWFGNTGDNYNVVEGVSPSSALKSWYYLDIDTDTPNHAIVSLKLYDSATKQSSIDENYNLPEITFKLSKNKLNFDETKIKLNQHGQYDVEYTSTSDGGSISAEYKTSKYTKVLGETDFQKLQRFIDEANVNDVIKLYQNFTYQVGVDTITSGITINKKVTIDGNGYTIDAKDQTRIFNMDSYNIPCLKNIKFANAKYDDYGGAIFSWKSIDVINCTFVNGSAGYGAFVYIYAESNFVNCTFINGHAQTSAGAILLYSQTFDLYNCTFINCSAQYGGSIYVNDATASVTNCTFINSTGKYGGAMYLYTQSKTGSTISNSTFKNCSVSGSDEDQASAGAIYIYDTINPVISNSTFENCKSDAQGGAIYTATESNKDSIIFNCTFINNIAGDGGAISMYGVNTTISNCTFINGAAGYGGGAIRSTKSFSLINSILINNTANNEGGAIQSYAQDVYIYNTTFINNTSPQGGAIRNDQPNLTVINSTFIHNTVTGEGGAIANYGNNLTIVNSTFNNNSAGFDKKGGAINAGGGNGCNVINSTFFNNSGDYGAVIFPV